VTSLTVTCALACLGTALITGWARRRAIRHAILDIPNERSSHRTATPRGGGIAIVLVMTIVASLAWAHGVLPAPVWLALLGGLLVAAAGYADDRRPLRPAVRLAAHFGAAAWAAYWLGGLPPLQIGAHVAVPGAGGYVLLMLAIVWTLNLFNFMDGIDGLAASEALFVAALGALLSVAANPGTLALAWVLAAACLGFLWWNWPTARIFLGDVGSGYLGYTVAVLAVSAARATPQGAWVWLILGGAFFVDATVTLVRRLLRGERPYEAHRSHAYQHLVRRCGSHAPVTLLYLGINVLWLAPLAWLASEHPARSLELLALALVPLALAAIACGAGTPEPPTPPP